LLEKTFARENTALLYNFKLGIGMNEVRTWLDQPRTIEAPSIAPSVSSRLNQGQSDGFRVARRFSILRLLFELLVHPWTIALVNAAILLVLVLGFFYMLHTGMEPLHQTEEIISGLGVILIGWGVALEERMKLREIFGLIGDDEVREREIDETCHRIGVGHLLFGLFSEIAVEAVRIPDEIINTSGIEKFVLAGAAGLLGIGAILLARHIASLVRA
jgi:hypothetical protein